MLKQNLAVAVASLPFLFAPTSTAIAEPSEPPEIEPPAAVAEEIIMPEPTASESALCNCWLYIKESYYRQLPSVDTILSETTDTFGDVAVFYYASSGLYHFAKVTGMGMGVFYIDETNYTRCTRTQREILFSDPNLIGFFTVKE